MWQKNSVIDSSHTEGGAKVHESVYEKHRYPCDDEEKQEEQEHKSYVKFGISDSSGAAFRCSTIAIRVVVIAVVRSGWTIGDRWPLCMRSMTLET